MLSLVGKYLEELFYLFAKNQWLDLRVFHFRKFRFFLPFCEAKRNYFNPTVR